MFWGEIMAKDQVVFSTAAYLPLAKTICELSGLRPGSVQRRDFPDSERYYRLEGAIADIDAVLLGGTISDRDTLELYDLAWAIVQAGARSLTLVIPYFGYSTMERAVKPGEVVMAKSRAHLLSSIPLANCGNRVVLVDLHSEGLPYYFDGHICPIHLYAKPIIIEAARELAGDDFVMASTDAGRAKWVESLANDMKVEAAFVYKRRIDDRHTKIAGVSARVEGKRVVIYDDMIRTGSSLLNAAAAYREAGAKEVFAIATHGLFPEDSARQIEAQGLLTAIVCTDSHPRALQVAGGFVRVRSIAPLLAKFLRP